MPPQARCRRRQGLRDLADLQGLQGRCRPAGPLDLPARYRPAAPRDLAVRYRPVALRDLPARCRPAGLRDPAGQCRPAVRYRLAAPEGLAGLRAPAAPPAPARPEEHTSEQPSLMRISYAVFCFKKKNDTVK